MIPVLYEWGKQAGVGYRYVWFFLVFCTIVGTSLMSGKIKKELGYSEESSNSSAASATASDGLTSAELMPLLAGKRSGGNNSYTSNDSDRMP